ncbi:MAG: MGMT family protein [Candidatus Woykebacteria bacterium]
MDTLNAVYKVVSSVPAGKVATYGQIAKIAGVKNPRVVGNILHKNIDPDNVPCHRVVNSKGDIADGYVFGGAAEQVKKLNGEGVKVTDNKVDLNNYRWSI